MKKGITLVLLFLLICSVTLFAGGKQEEAEENKVLKIITWSGYAPQELIDKFTEETGIKVEVTLSNNEEMISKLRATRGAGFDLAQPSQDRISSVVEQYQLYQPIDYSQIDEDQIDPSLLKAVKKNTMVDGKSYGVPHVYGTSGLIVNKAKAPDVEDYTDLLDPKYNGRVSYRLKRPTLIGMGFAHGYDPFELYNDPDAYQEFLDDIGEKLI
ncbi:MAG: extracellular solute-binding protein, partial [Spirochaetota bacterium]